MLFHAAAVVTNRRGKAMRDPKPGAKPNGPSFDDSDMVDVTYGQIAVLALDTALPGDDKAVKDKPDQWVRQVMRRDEISRAIVAATQDGGDGWVNLKEDQINLLKERVALLLQQAPFERTGVVVAGQIIGALENPPEKKPVAPVREAAE